MAGNKKKTVWVCSDCGYDAPKWVGKCPVCGAWNTMAEQTLAPERPERAFAQAGQAAKPLRLSEIAENEQDVRFSTGIGELDRVLGGGMVRGSLVLVSGEPGIGKSTLLLQACASLCAQVPVLYITGEESLAQIKLRARRLRVDDDQLLVCAATELDTVLETARRTSPEVLIIDSIQTMFNPELQSTPGSVTQVRECALALMQFAKNESVSVILVGHVNKDGGIAGPKVLEHMVDAVLSFEGDRHIAYRMLRAAKNRYGSTNEIGMFEMTDLGLMEVQNPSAALLSGRPENASGSCVAAALEGTRPILAEVQGLVTKSAYGASRRTSNGIDYNRAVLLMAIIEKRVGFQLGAFDAYVNVVGGLSLEEPAADLPVVLAVASSYLDKAISPDLAVFGEVGLSGEVRAVSGAGQRVAELRRLGFKKCILPKASMKSVRDPGELLLIPVSDVKEAIKKCFE